MQGSARKDVVFGAAGVYPVTVPGPKWKSWLNGLPFLFGDFGNRFNFADTVQTSDHVSVIAGSHNLKFGAEHHYVALERDAANFGSLNFGSNESGLPFPSYLLGLPSRTGSPLGLSESNSRTNRLGFYVHDDWKLSPRVTINLGLRFDYNGNPVDRDGLWRSINFCGEELPAGRGPGCFTDPNTGLEHPTIGPAAVGEGGDIKLWKQDVRFFMPRLGIAYRPSEKWVVRMGAGSLLSG